MTKSKSRQSFERTLCGYSSLSSSAALTAIAVATAATAHAAITQISDQAGLSATFSLSQLNSHGTFMKGGNYLDPLNTNMNIQIQVGRRFSSAGGVLGANVIGDARIKGYGIQFATDNGKAALLGNGASPFNFAHWQGAADFITATVAQAVASPAGNFALGQVGYLAFKANAYYGWLRVKIDGSSDGRPNSIEFVAVDGSIGEFGLAHDDLRTFGNGSSVPEPKDTVAGLALFALGAVGIREYRRRKAVAA